MPLGLTSRDRKQKKLPRPASAQPGHSTPSYQPSQSTVYMQQQSYTNLMPTQNMLQSEGYPRSPPEYIAQQLRPLAPQHHPIYGPVPQPSHQNLQPASQQAYSFDSDSTVSFATSSPPKDGTLKSQWNKAERLASKSYHDLTAQINLGTNKSVAAANNLASNYIEKPTVVVTKKSIQMLSQSAALCDRLSCKLDAVITSIDEGIFSGKEQDLMVEEEPLSHASSFTNLQDASQARLLNVPYAVINNTKSSNMFSKVWMYSNSRLPPHLPPFKVYIPTYPLLCLAAAYSDRVYAPVPAALPSTDTETHIPADWRSGTKAMILKSLPRDDMNTIVFAIRGSQTFMDWAVNYRSEPSSPKEFLDDPGNLCHSGFLYVARKMIAPVSERLRILLQENPSRSSCSLLITGHSAGGAVAALLYAHMMSTQVQSELNYLTGFFKRVHCITFGAPPITLLPLQKSDDKRHRKSLFYSFINEGDPVPRADKAVVRNLLKLYSSSPPSPSYVSSMASIPHVALSSTSQTTLQASTASVKHRRSKKFNRPSKTSLTTTNTTATAVISPSWPIVPCTLSNAGRLIVLRQKFGGTGTDDIEAITVDDDMLRKVVYGDPIKHQMSMYKQRIELIATKAVTASGS